MVSSDHVVELHEILNVESQLHVCFHSRVDFNFRLVRPYGLGTFYCLCYEMKHYGVMKS